MNRDLIYPKTASGNSGVTSLKLLILGSGPSGLSAALYAARANLNPVVLTGMDLGGQVSLTYSIENYPGFPEGLGGPQLVELFKKQAEQFGAKIEFDTAIDVDLSRRPFKVKTYNTSYLVESLIIATGATPSCLGIPGEKELIGKGVSYCATCDGWFFKDKEVAVIGGGDSALEEAVFLTRYAKNVIIIHRRNAFRAGVVLQERAKNNSKIKFIMNTISTKIIGQEAVRALVLRNVVTNEEREMPFDGVFIFIGHVPSTKLFQNQINLDEKGYILVDKLMRTNVPGVFAAGEVSDPYFRQVITSAGMGAAAAIQANRFLEEVKS